MLYVSENVDISISRAQSLKPRSPVDFNADTTITSEKMAKMMLWLRDNFSAIQARIDTTDSLKNKPKK